MKQKENAIYDLPASCEAGLIEAAKKHNLSVHIYNKENADEITDLIFDTYITVFYNLKNKLSVKISESDGN